MKLIALSVRNFRCFRDEVSTSIADLTTFVGKNDIGKSSILEALEIFFNNKAVKIDTDDANVFNRAEPVVITCEFTDLPGSLTLDAGATTSLAGEYLLTEAQTLRIRKVYDCSKQKITPEVQILAFHPTAAGVSGLLELKEKELQKIIKDKGLDASLKGNPGMRRAICQGEIYPPPFGVPGGGDLKVTWGVAPHKSFKPFLCPSFSPRPIFSL